MLLDVLLEQRRALLERGPGEVSRKASVQVGDRLAQAAVRGCVQDRLVEEVVRLHPDALVVPVRRCAPRRAISVVTDFRNSAWASRSRRRSRSLIRSAASSAASPSSSARTSYASRISRAEGPRTTAPRLGCTSTRPVACSWRSASRTGVRLTSNSSASASCRRRVPTGTSAAQHLGLDRRGEPFDEGRALRPGVPSQLAPAPSPSGVADETQADEGEQGGKDQAQHVGRERECEQGARDTRRPRRRRPCRAQGRSPTAARLSARLAARAVGRITSSEVASASCCVIPTARTRNGTSRTPPPTPSSPASTPAAAPTATSTTKSPSVLSARPPSTRRRSA